MTQLVLVAQRDGVVVRAPGFSDRLGAVSMWVVTHILQGSGRLTAHADRLRTRVADATERIRADLCTDAGGGTRTPDTRIMIPLL